jgi:hypothetical protein
MGEDPSTIRQDIEQTRERMGDTVDALAYKTDVKNRAKDSVSNKVEAAKTKITGAAGAVGDATPSSGAIKGTAHRAVGMAQENPLGLAIGAVAVGFLAGMLVPATRVEHAKLGPMADQVKDQVKEAAQVAVEHGKEVTQEVATAAAETAKEAGQQHAEDAKSDLQRQAQQAKER